MLTTLGGIALTSCLNDDDDNDTIPPITAAEKQARLLLMDGYYTGHVYFVNDSTQKADSVAIDWVVSARDSAVIINNFPVKILANGISNTEKHNMLANSETKVPLISYIYFYNNNSGDNDLYTFWNIPKEQKLSFKITDDQEKEHSVDIKFQEQLNTLGSTGLYASYYAIGDYKKGEMDCFYIINDVIIDNNTYTVNRVIYIWNKY